MSERERKTKEFDIETILSITTGRFICNDIMQIHHIVELLYGELMYTFALGLIQEETGKYLCEHYPTIRSLTEQYLAWADSQDWEEVTNVEDRAKKVNDYVSKLKSQYGDKIELTSLSDTECYTIYGNLREATSKQK